MDEAARNDEQRQHLKAVEDQIADAREVIVLAHSDLARAQGILREALEHRQMVLEGREFPVEAGQPR